MVSTHVDTKNKRVSRSIVLAAIAVMSACIRPTASAAVLHTKENSNIVQDQTTQVMPLNESSTGLRAQRGKTLPPSILAVHWLHVSVFPPTERRDGRGGVHESD